MKIAYVNTYFVQNHTGGGHVHMGQFVKNTTELGHEIWTYGKSNIPGVNRIPTDHINHIKTMRKMDVLYIRLEQKFPVICKWSLPPRRLLYGFPIVVWEFNTIPEDAAFRGETEKNINKVIKLLKHYGRGCDLAVCVSPASEKYVKEKLGINRTIVISNGSDPDLFNPNKSPVQRMKSFVNNFNVVWIGSAKIKYHDFETIREAANIIWKKEDGNKICFHIIGPEFNFQMADMPPNVFYWGAEEYEKLPNWLASMDLGLYITKGGTSSYGSPLKIFDYFASGLPVVSTTHPFVSNLFNQLNQSDLMISIEDSKSLANIILELSTNKNQSRILGMEGRKLIIEKYNWKNSVIETVDEIENILLEKKGYEKK